MIINPLKYVLIRQSGGTLSSVKVLVGVAGQLVQIRVRGEVRWAINAFVGALTS